MKRFIRMTVDIAYDEVNHNKILEIAFDNLQDIEWAVSPASEIINYSIEECELHPTQTINITNIYDEDEDGIATTAPALHSDVDEPTDTITDDIV